MVSQFAISYLSPALTKSWNQPHQIRSPSFEGDSPELVDEGDDHDQPIFTVIQPEDRKKWAAYLSKWPAATSTRLCSRTV